MKKINKVILIFALVLMISCLFAACNENTKQPALETSTDFPTVTSNGGVAVQYGNYLYFVNGYAGVSALNTFGSVKTGAVCRIEVKKNDGGELYYDYSTFKVVVPKNVYGTDTTHPGIYIVGNYIYYHTTSIDKNSKREYKTDHGVLMRSTLDGSKSEVIENFSDNATVFYVSNNYLVYAVKDGDSNTKLYSINLTDLSDKKEIDSHNVVAYNFSESYMVYTTYNYDRPDNTSSDYLVKLFDFKTGSTTLLMSSDIYNRNTKGYLFTTTVKSIIETKNYFYLFYSKDDNSNDDIYNGYYYCYFLKVSPKYTPEHEYRMTFQADTTTYERFFLLDNGWVLAYNDKVFDIYDKSIDGTSASFGTATRKENAPEKVEKEGAFLTYTLTDATALIDVYENDTEVYAYFATSSTIDEKSYTALNYIKLFDKTNGYAVAKENVGRFFYFNNNSTYTTYEVSSLYYYEAAKTTEAKAIYFLNSDLGDNAIACYYIFQGGNDKDNASATGKVLGQIEGEKLVGLISSGAVEEE